MLVIKQKMIYRTDIRSNPSLLYVFGDNLDRVGMGGQAAEMRGEPNSFGVATKRSITHSYPEDYFFDYQDDVIPILEDEFNRLEKTLATFNPKQKYLPAHHIYHFDGVVIPADGLGTGLSRLPQFAPEALEFIETRIEQLKDL
jgi:hypothetical protein